ncbi:LIM/homeobox protein LMX-1.2-like [Stigmatopora argus]
MFFQVHIEKAMQQHKQMCVGCHCPITDKYLVRVSGGLRHQGCARCSACGQTLKGSCFEREQRLYCKRDYAELFSVRCGGCSESISPSEMIQRAGSSIFHERCFTCNVCGTLLRAGDRCVFREGRLMCVSEERNCFAANPTSSDTCKSDDVDVNDKKTEGRPPRRPKKKDEQEGKRPKRARTILTTEQIRAFQASFEVSSKPFRPVLEALAADTGLEFRVVEVWFQNQRAKRKRRARCQPEQEQEQPTQEQQEQPLPLQAPSNDVPHAQMELPGSSCSYVQPQPQPQHQHQHLHQHQHNMALTRVKQQDFGMDPFGLGLTPPQIPGDHMQPYGLEAPYGSVLDMECTPFGDTSYLLSPIDCLNSMRDSYFTS